MFTFPVAGLFGCFVTGPTAALRKLLRVSLIVVEFQNDVDFVSKVPLKHTKYI